MLQSRIARVVSAAMVAGWASTAAAAPIVFEVGGDATTASIQATIDSFRAALGDPNNGNAPGPLASGRREINWDGGGSATTVIGTPFTGFQNNRGATFITAGTGFVQAPPSGLATQFGNSIYATIFGTFSAQGVFVPVGSNVTDVFFSIPGTMGSVAAAVRGFGAVFTDVDVADTTQMQFFDLDGNLLLSDFVPAGSVADASLSFLGVVFDGGELIGRVRITTGNAALSSTANDGSGVDVVAMDDFLYSEPAAVPEPDVLALFAVSAGFLLLATPLLARSQRAAA